MRPKRRSGPAEAQPTFKRPRTVPKKIFICYAWKEYPEQDVHAEWVNNLGKRFQDAGYEVILDQDKNLRSGDIRAFVEQINEVDYIVVVGTPEMYTKARQVGHIVGRELSLIFMRLAKNPSCVFPVLKEGSFETAFPGFLAGQAKTDLSTATRMESEFPGIVKDMQQWSDEGTVAGDSQSDQVADHLRKCYTRAEKALLMPLFADTDDESELPILEAFINVAIILDSERRAGEESMEATNLRNRPGILGIYEDIHKPKKPIKLEDLFEQPKIGSDTETAKRLLVVGRAGIGKTTMCQYLACAWSINMPWLSRFKRVFWVPIRELTEDKYPEQDVHWSKIVQRECCPEVDEQDIQRVVEETPDQVLVILDGYDERVYIPKLMRDVVERWVQDVDRFPNLILTTRPEPNLPKLDIRLETIGFTDDNIDTFVETIGHYRGLDQDARNRLIAYIRSHPEIQGIAHIPLQLELLVSLWKYHDNRITEPGFRLTMTRLYHDMMTWMLTRYLRDKQQVENADQLTDQQIWAACDKEVRTCCTLGYVAMKNGHIILTEQDIEESVRIEPELDLKAALKVGLIKPTRGYGRLAKNGYYFLHLSMAEYWCGFQLAQLTEDIQREFIQNHQFEPAYRLVFQFWAGSMRTPEALESVIQMGTTPNRDLLGIEQSKWVWLCLDESEYGPSLYQKIEEQTQANQRITGLTTLGFIMQSGQIFDQIMTFLKQRTWIKEPGTVRLRQLLATPAITNFIMDRVSEIFQKIGHIDDEAKQAITQFLSDDTQDIFLRIRVAEGLRSIGKLPRAVRAVIEILGQSDMDPGLRRRLVDAFQGAQTEDDAHTFYLMHPLDDPNIDENSKRRVAAALEKGENGILDLIGVLSNPDAKALHRLATHKLSSFDLTEQVNHLSSVPIVRVTKCLRSTPIEAIATTFSKKQDNFMAFLLLVKAIETESPIHIQNDHLYFYTGGKSKSVVIPLSNTESDSESSQTRLAKAAKLIQDQLTDIQFMLRNQKASWDVLHPRSSS